MVLRPEVRPGQRVDELSGDADPISRSADAALEDVPHAQLPAQGTNVDGPVLVGERTVARDDQQRVEPRERRDDLFGNPVGEILLPRVTGHVREREHRDRRLVGHRQVDAARRDRRGGQRVRFHGRHGEAVAPSLHRADRLGPEQLAKCRDLDRQVVLLDHHPRPDQREQFVLPDHAVAPIDQRHQHVERPGAQRNGLAGLQHPALIRSDFEASKEVAARHGFPQSGAADSPAEATNICRRPRACERLRTFNSFLSTRRRIMGDIAAIDDGPSDSAGFALPGRGEAARLRVANQRRKGIMDSMNGRFNGRGGVVAVVVGLGTALAAGGCAVLEPSASSYKPPPPGSTFTRVEDNTGSFGKGRQGGEGHHRRTDLEGDGSRSVRQRAGGRLYLTGTVGWSPSSVRRTNPS